MAQHQPLLAVDIPDDFPAEPYLSLHARVLSSRGSAELLEEFAAGWLALAYRFVALAESDAAFTASLRQFGAAPAPYERYRQERELFGFFATGLATLEGLAYGLFVLGALLRPEDFLLSTPAERRSALLGATLRNYGQFFGREELTRRLFWWLNSREFGWWKEVRAALAQRTAPGRLLLAPPEQGAVQEWRLRGETVDARLTGAKRAWLVEVLTELLREADAFAAKQLG